MEEVFDYPKEIIESANQYLASNGIMFKKDTCSDTFSYNPAPISLRPSPFPKNVYDSIRYNQTSVNSLVDILMRNIDKVIALLDPLAKIDPFIASLIKITQEVQKLPYHQIGYLGILRTDYMITDDKQAKLVELNTIASGLGAISTLMADFYRYIKFIGASYTSKHHSSYDVENIADDNDNINGIVDAMKQAHDLYIEKRGELVNRPIMAYIVDYEEANICDQKHIENTLFFKHKLVSRRLTFADINEYCELKETGELVYKGREEITVVYYRSGYSPTQYRSDEDWEARETLEKSLAVKCPSVALQLLTFKKIQELLSRPSVWHELVGPADFDEIKGLFAGQMWGFEEITPEIEEVIADAKMNPEKYVLKTQREGGGNNYFGDDIPHILEKTEDLMQYSLMKRIFPKEFEG